jgi:hypothetical protein
MAEPMVVRTHVEVANPGEEPDAKGCVVCIHTSRWLTARETEIVRVSVELVVRQLFAMVGK